MEQGTCWRRRNRRVVPDSEEAIQMARIMSQGLRSQLEVVPWGIRWCCHCIPPLAQKSHHSPSSRKYCLSCSPHRSFLWPRERMHAGAHPCTGCRPGQVLGVQGQQGPAFWPHLGPAWKGFLEDQLRPQWQMHSPIAQFFLNCSLPCVSPENTPPHRPSHTVPGQDLLPGNPI